MKQDEESSAAMADASLTARSHQGSLAPLSHCQLLRSPATAYCCRPAKSHDAWPLHAMTLLCFVVAWLRGSRREPMAMGTVLESWLWMHFADSSARVIVVWI